MCERERGGEGDWDACATRRLVPRGTLDARATGPPREREGERKTETESERQSVCVCVREREIVCVYVCLYVRMCVREREREKGNVIGMHVRRGDSILAGRWMPALQVLYNGSFLSRIALAQIGPFSLVVLIKNFSLSSSSSLL